MMSLRDSLAESARKGTAVGSFQRLRSRRAECRRGSRSPVHASDAARDPKKSGSQWTLRWREMDSNFRFLVARPSNRHGRSDRFLETWADLLGNRRFESISLQR
jgi:hypothetical protein